MTALLIDALTELVIGAAIAVHTALGPGLLESIYRDALVIELTAMGISAKTEVSVPVFYRGQRVRGDLKIDLLVDGRLVIEIKAVDRIHPVFEAQVITYLKLTGHPAGLLMNFNATTLRAGLRRLDHPDVYAAKHARVGNASPPVEENTKNQ